MSTATGLDVNFAEEDSSEEDEDLAPSTVAASAPSSVDADTAAAAAPTAETATAEEAAGAVGAEVKGPEALAAAAPVPAPLANVAADVGSAADADGVTAELGGGSTPELTKPELTAAQLEAEAAVQRNPWNGPAWTAFAKSASGTPAEPWILEQLLARFPTSAVFWYRLAEHSMAKRRWAEAEDVFDRCLPTCPRLDLWKLYLKCICEARLGADATLPPHRARQQVKEKYEYVLDHVGGSRHADTIWLDYVAFLQDAPQVDPNEVRAVFQRAVVVPTEQLDLVWSRYTRFENELNETMAPKILEGFQPKVNSARAVLRDRKHLMDGIVPVHLPAPPSGAREETKQLHCWQRLLVYEDTNPERLSAQAHKSRMRIAYRHCLCSFYHFPEVWHDFASYEARTGDVEDACLVYRSAMEVLPTSQLLGFAYAELEEQRGRLEEARAVYDRLLEESPHAVVWIQLMRFARRSDGQAAGRKVFSAARKSEHCTYHVWVASALMERDANEQQDVARRVFEKGLTEKGFGSEPDYVEAYVSFLEGMNADGTTRTNNLRALFEKALQQLPPAKSRHIWRRYLDLEYRSAVGGGDVSTAMELEERYAEAFSDDAPERRLGMFRLLHRYRTMDLLPSSASDMAYLRRYPSLLREDSEHAQLPTPPALAATVTGGGGASVATSGVFESASTLAGTPAARGGMGGALSSSVGRGEARGQLAAPAAPPELPEQLHSFFAILPPSSQVHLSGPVPDAEKLLRTLREMPLPARPPVIDSKRPFEAMSAQGGGGADTFRDRQQKRGRY